MSIFCGLLSLEDSISHKLNLHGENAVAEVTNAYAGVDIYAGVASVPSFDRSQATTDAVLV
jgi:hypothetical protein